MDIFNVHRVSNYNYSQPKNQLKITEKKLEPEIKRSVSHVRRVHQPQSSQF